MKIDRFYPWKGKAAIVISCGKVLKEEYKTDSSADRIRMKLISSSDWRG
jgi:hypothetical protein